MSGFDAESRAVVVEFVAVIVWCFWATMISWWAPFGTERDFDPIDRFGTLCVGAAVFVSVIALAGHQPIGDDRHLNRWDEAMALYGADCLVDIAVVS